MRKCNLARPRLGDSVGLRSYNLQGQGLKFLLPTKTSRVWAQLWGRSAVRRRVGSQVSFSRWSDFSSWLTLVWLWSFIYSPCHLTLVTWQAWKTCFLMGGGESWHAWVMLASDLIVFVAFFSQRGRLSMLLVGAWDFLCQVQTQIPTQIPFILVWQWHV